MPITSSAFHLVVYDDQASTVSSREKLTSRIAVSSTSGAFPPGQATSMPRSKRATPS